MRNIIFKILLIASLLFLTGFVYAWITGIPGLTGPLLTGFFVSLAISFYGHGKLKKFAYTIWIFAAVTVSMNYPQFFRQIGDFDLKKSIVPLLQIIMFGMGSQLSIKNFADVIRMPRGVIVGIVCQFTIMPIVGVSVARAFGFPPEIAAGIILVGCSPSGLASNVMSFIARANLALAVTLTAVATLLAPLMTPLLMKLLAGQYVPIDFWSMMLSIVNIVILPIVAGLIFNAIGYGLTRWKSIVIQAFVYLLIIIAKNFLNFQINDVPLQQFLSSTAMDMLWFSLLPIVAALIFRYYARGRKGWLDKVMSFVSMLGIGVIITIITAAGRDSLMAIGLALILACLIHNLAGYFLGYWICRLLRMDEKSCRTIALEVGMQNGGLASGIALEMGKVETIGLAAAVFGPMMNVTGSSLATWWRGKTEPETGESNEGSN
ncbi:MAG: bile acid:sodium symporter [Bacteroides sp. SM23_62]|nr:MAG: bile acid:sodium symporter [Bacteroides sp. SM23_62]